MECPCISMYCTIACQAGVKQGRQGGRQSMDRRRGTGKKEEFLLLPLAHLCLQHRLYVPGSQKCYMHEYTRLLAESLRPSLHVDKSGKTLSSIAFYLRKIKAILLHLHCNTWKNLYFQINMLYSRMKIF